MSAKEEDNRRGLGPPASTREHRPDGARLMTGSDQSGVSSHHCGQHGLIVTSPRRPGELMHPSCIVDYRLVSVGCRETGRSRASRAVVACDWLQRDDPARVFIFGVRLTVPIGSRGVGTRSAVESTAIGRCCAALALLFLRFCCCRPSGDRRGAGEERA